MSRLTIKVTFSLRYWTDTDNAYLEYCTVKKHHVCVHCSSGIEELLPGQVSIPPQTKLITLTPVRCKTPQTSNVANPSAPIHSP